MGSLRKICNDGGLTSERVAMVVIDLPSQDSQESQQSQHAEGGGESSQHAEMAGNKLAVP